MSDPDEFESGPNYVLSLYNRLAALRRIIISTVFMKGGTMNGMDGRCTERQEVYLITDFGFYFDLLCSRWDGLFYIIVKLYVNYLLRLMFL